jgi:PAS domain S-box-containing protein
MPTFSNNTSLILRKIWLIVAMFIILFIFFSLYVHSEQLVDQANLHRQISYKLADRLRQSSDELSQMARSYVATRDPHYKKYYHDILAIRNGTKAKPQGYSSDIYWDLVLANESLPTESGQAISLLEEMRQSGFNELELSKMAQAIAYSDHLAALELDAMKLVEDDGPNAEINHKIANLLLRDEKYYHAKVTIMQPINEFYAMVNSPNFDAVRKKKEHASIFRLIFIFVSLITVFLLWRFYQELHTTLGASADEIHALMLKIGRGNFSTPINITSHKHNSVLSGLSEMQKQLHDIEIERKKSEEQLHVAAAFFESQEAMMISNSDNIILRVNQAFTRITGYSANEVVGQSSRYLQSDRHSDDFYKDIWRTVKNTGGWQGESWGRRKNGEIYPKWLTISVVKNKQNQITHYITMHSDISIHKQAEDKIRELAFFDQLTNLPNRRLLLDRLKQGMMNSARSGKYKALLFIDLDNL